jgi:hypothetical protein
MKTGDIYSYYSIGKALGEGIFNHLWIGAYG